MKPDRPRVGRFKSGASFGHDGEYPYLLQVYKVEAFRSSGYFRPLPGAKKKIKDDPV
jgi:hypothetical protein